MTTEFSHRHNNKLVKNYYKNDIKSNNSKYEYVIKK